jgi:hypothetical protein
MLLLCDSGMFSKRVLEGHHFFRQYNLWRVNKSAVFRTVLETNNADC